MKCLCLLGKIQPTVVCIGTAKCDFYKPESGNPDGRRVVGEGSERNIFKSPIATKMGAWGAIDRGGGVERCVRSGPDLRALARRVQPLTLYFRC
jgi:hypothetical protein